jgi:hypothetical protein
MTLDKDSLQDILRNFRIPLNEIYIDELLEIVFPPKFIPKDGEAIWVKAHENDVPKLRVFKYIDNNGRYVVFSENGLGADVPYKFAMSQTHVEKGL